MAAQAFSTEPSAPSIQRHHPPVIGHDVAFIKMEQKLKEAMNRIAELTNEKENLEHLNIQLQEETDTVGEWAAVAFSRNRKLFPSRIQD